MSEEKFEEFLRDAAKRYNEPPNGVPRDEMFTAITAARRSGAGSPAQPVRLPRLTKVAWMGMAATLVIGVAIGRYALVRRDSATRAAPTAAPGDSHDLAALPVGGATRRGADTIADASYARAAASELGRAEALLTAYGASTAEVGVDRQLSEWARDILLNTRLLLDSPAALDPARRRLLQDLELVLVQMVQRSPAAGTAAERAQIDRSLDRTQMLSRLRSALPAGRNNGI